MRLFLLLILSSLSFAKDSLSLDRFEMTSHEGKQISLKAFKGQPIFLSFVFTRCPMPEMCPLTIQLNKKLGKIWKKEFPNVPLKHVLVTLDPEFDNPSVLKKYRADVGLSAPNFVFTTGNPKVLSDLAAEFNVVAFPDKNTLSHNLKSILLGPELETIREFKDNEWKPEDVVTEFKKWVQGVQKRG